MSIPERIEDIKVRTIEAGEAGEDPEVWLHYSGNTSPEHQIGSQYGNSYDVLYKFITENCGFTPLRDDQYYVENKNDFHIVKNALIYAFYKIDKKMIMKS